MIEWGAEPHELLELEKSSLSREGLEVRIES